LPNLKKCTTLGKMHHPLGKMRRIWKNVPTLKKLALHLKKCATLGKVTHTWKSPTLL